MEPFTFNRQTIAFLCVLAVVELVMVATFSLVAAMIGALAVPLLFFVWVKTGIRSGKWIWWNPVAVPLTQTEGALVLSGALLLSIGTIDVGRLWVSLPPSGRKALVHYYFPTLAYGRPSVPVGSHAINYGEATRQQQVKDELAKAGIPFTLDTHDGKEFIVWAPQYDAAAQQILRKVEQGPPAGHNVSFNNPEEQRKFREWLGKRGISNEIVNADGEPYVVWKDGPDDLLNQYLKETSVPCPRDKPASASGKVKAPPC